MTFVDLQNNTTADADDVDGNFKHVNFGSDLIPVDVDGDGVDGALDLGTSTYRWDNGLFSGNIFADGQDRAAGGFAQFSGGTALCPNNAWTAVEFTNDSSGSVAKVGITHSTTTNPSRWNLGTRGVFLIHGAVTFVANATGIRGAGVRIVGSTLLRAYSIQQATANEMTVTFSGFIRAQSDSVEIELAAFQNSGGTLSIRQTPTVDTSINPTQGATRFEIWRLG